MICLQRLTTGRISTWLGCWQRASYQAAQNPTSPQDASRSSIIKGFSWTSGSRCLSSRSTTQSSAKTIYINSYRWWEQNEARLVAKGPAGKNGSSLSNLRLNISVFGFVKRHRYYSRQTRIEGGEKETPDPFLIRSGL